MRGVTRVGFPKRWRDRLCRIEGSRQRECSLVNVMSIGRRDAPTLGVNGFRGNMFSVRHGLASVALARVTLLAYWAVRHSSPWCQQTCSAS